MGVHIIKASKVPDIHNITENNTDGWMGNVWRSTFIQNVGL